MRIAGTFLLVAVCGTVGLTLGLETVAPRLAVRVHAASPRESMLTSVSDLASAIDRKDPTLVILQTGSQATYTAGHIPGAYRATMTQFSTPMDMSGNTLMTELPTEAALRATLESFGITAKSHIVLAESDTNHPPTTRIYLTLVHAGLGSNTTLLDGGLAAWKAAGHPTSTDVPVPTKSTMAPLSTVAVTVDAAYVQAHEKTPGTVILDMRTAAAWNGIEAVDSKDGTKRYGHIPGARSLPYPKLWNDDGTALRTAAELERAFADAGVKPGDTIIGYCYVGQNATATIFAAKTLGHPALLYDGSMEEWGKLGLPLEMPEKKGGGR
jgi:thiosulfate/3-mercaptopyruvate sulfurtransferase